MKQKQQAIPWDDYFMTMVYLAAMRSKDESTHLGAVIVGPDNEIRSTGYNSFPRRVEQDSQIYPERQVRPGKYFWFEHAERNAIYNATLMGVSLKGCRMYTNGVPCSDCARGVIQSGIVEIVIDQAWDMPGEEWRESIKTAMQMLQEAKVTVRYWHGQLLEIHKFKRGEILA